MKKYIFFLFLLSACSTGEIIVLPQQVEVLSSLPANKPAQTILYKIFSINEPVDTLQPFYAHAQLILLEDGIFFDSLHYKGEGIYESTKKIRSERSYVLKGTIKGVSEFYSNPVTIPALPSPLKYQYIVDTTGIHNENLRAAYFQMDVVQSKLSSMPYFMLGFQVNYEGFSSTTNTAYASETIEKAVFICSTSGLEKSAIFKNNKLRGASIYDTQCLERTINSLPLFIQRQNFGTTTTNPTTLEIQDAKSITAIYGNVSKELFLWRSTNAKQPTSGVERFSIDPVINYTNFVGAQGVVFGLNLTKIELN